LPLVDKLQELLQRPFGAPLHAFGEEKALGGQNFSRQAIVAESGMEARSIHLRQTLRTGQVHVHPAVRGEILQSCLLIDAGPSVTYCFSRDELQALQEFFLLWGSRHHRQVHVVLGPAQLSWGPDLWKYWEQAHVARSGTQTVILSDFHGPMPKGSFWNRCFSEGILRILQVCHPLPEWGEKTVFKGFIADSQHYLYEQEAFLREWTKWKTRWSLEQRKTGFRRLESKAQNLWELARDLQNCMNLG
jgi:hypothetical protein